MFGSTYIISIMMRWAGGQVISGMNSLGNAFGKAATKMDIATASLAKFNKLGTAVAGIFALAGASIIGFGIVSAAKLQMAMTGTYAITHASMSQQKSLSDQVMQMSDRTAQNAVTIAREQFIAAKSGLGTYSQLHSLFPTLAMAADVMWAGTRGTHAEIDPQGAVQALSALAHMFGAYQGTDMKNAMDMLVRVAFNQPESLMRMQTQSQYFVGSAMGYGVPLQDIADTYSIMGQTGKLRSKGGTGVENMMLRLMGATTTKKNVGFLKDLHLWDSHGIKSEFDPMGADGKRHLQLTKVVDFLANERAVWERHGKGNEFMDDLYAAMNVQAGNYAGIVTQKHFHDQTIRNRRVRDQMAAPGKAIQTLFDLFVKGTFMGAFSRFATSFVNVFTNLFTPFVKNKAVIGVINAMADALGNLNDFLVANPGVATALASLIVALTGLSALRFLIGASGGLFSLLSRIPVIFEAFGPLGGALRVLDAVLLGGIAGRIAAVAQMMYGLRGALIDVAMTPLGIALLAAGAAVIATNKRDAQAKKNYHTMAARYGHGYANYRQSLDQSTDFNDPVTKFFRSLLGVSSPKPLTPDQYKNIIKHGGKPARPDYADPVWKFLEGMKPLTGHQLNSMIPPWYRGTLFPDSSKKAPTTIHNQITVHYSQPSTVAQAEQVAELVLRYIKSGIQSAGDIFTTPGQAPVLSHHDLAATI